jgi:hypothetical protein
MAARPSSFEADRETQFSRTNAASSEVLETGRSRTAGTGRVPPEGRLADRNAADPLLPFGFAV